MTALAGGLAAAFFWGVATVCSSRSSRLIGAGSVLAWVMLIGVVLTVPAALVLSPPTHLRAATWGWLLLAAVGSVLGLGLVYAALRRGKVGVVAPITATEGAIAAVIAVAAGESLPLGAAAMLAVIAAGVVLASLGGDASGLEARRNDRLAALLAILAATMFGESLYAAGQAGEAVSAVVVVAVARILGLVCVTVPLYARGRIRLTRPALPFVLVAGVFEVLGMVSFVVASTDGVAVPAVLGSQFATVAAVAGYVLFGERLRRVQIVGVGAVLTGVAVLSALSSGGS